MREIYKEKKYIGEKMREKWVDILKGMGIIFVCLGHLSPGIFTETHIYSFHMPLFFFISGYLFCRKEHNETFDFIKAKVKGLVVPYCFYAIISIVIGSVLKIVSINDLREILNCFLFLKGSVGWNAPIWFLVVLFLGEVFYFLLYKRLKFKNLMMFIFIIGLLGYVFQFNQLILPFGLHIVPIAMTFMHIGVLFRRWDIKKFILKNSYLSMMMGLILNVLFGYILDIRISVYHQNYGNYIFFYIASISGIILYSTIALKINENRLLEMYGRNSLLILGTQYILFRLYFMVEGYSVIKLMYTNSFFVAVGLTLITMVFYFVVITFGALIMKRDKKV